MDLTENQRDFLNFFTWNLLKNLAPLSWKKNNHHRNVKRIFYSEMTLLLQQQQKNREP